MTPCYPHSSYSKSVRTNSEDLNQKHVVKEEPLEQCQVVDDQLTVKFEENTTQVIVPNETKVSKSVFNFISTRNKRLVKYNKTLEEKVKCEYFKKKRYLWENVSLSFTIEDMKECFLKEKAKQNREINRLRNELAKERENGANLKRLTIENKKLKDEIMVIGNVGLMSKLENESLKAKIQELKSERKELKSKILQIFDE